MDCQQCFLSEEHVFDFHFDKRYTYVMRQISTSNVIKNPDVILNPVFFLPPDVIDVRVGDTSDPSEEDGVTYDDVVESSDVLVDDTPNIPIDDDGEGAEVLPTPQWMNIIDQQVRIAPDGKAVVDVVIELEDVTGATEYDIRMTKV
jgi:hypothetical protein